MSVKTEKETTTSTNQEVETRSVTIYSTQSKSSQTIETSASTWGELRSELSGTKNVRAVVRETRNSLEGASSKLPNNDFTLFLYPERVKSGNEELLQKKSKRISKIPKIASTALEASEWENLKLQEAIADTLSELKVEYNSALDELKLKDVDLSSISKEDQEMAKEAAAIAAELRM